MNANFHIRKVAVLGAGVMGAQIAAHCANAEVSVVLFDLTAKEGDPNGIARRAIDHATSAACGLDRDIEHGMHGARILVR